MILKRMAILLGLLAALCWGLHDLAARSLAPKMGGFRLGYRTELAGFVILLPLLLQVRGGTTSDWMWILVLGFIYAAAIAGLFKAFSMAPVSLVGPFTAGYPALVVVWGLFTGISISAFQTIAIFVIISGAVIVGRMGHEQGGLKEVKGPLLAFFFWIALAVISFAASIIIGQKLGPIFGDIETAGLMRLPAATILMLFATREPAESKSLNLPIIAWIIFIGCLDIIALSGINYMGRLPDKEMGAMAISAYGALSVLLASIWLKEKVTKGQWAGIALICVGVFGLGS